MSKRLAALVLGFVGAAGAAGCESGRGAGRSSGGGGGTFAHGYGGGGGGGGHGWTGESRSSNAPRSSGRSGSSGSDRPSLHSTGPDTSKSTHARVHARSGSDAVGSVFRAVGYVLPTLAEALLVGGGDYDVDVALNDEPDPAQPISDPCLSCPLEDACGTCVGYGDYACRETVAGVLSRCESTAPPNVRMRR